ncbi:MAG: holo-ACP synthase [Fimbriimonadaceae bacterium]
MITGLGIDLVELARIAQAMRNPRFVSKILTPRERAYDLTVQFVAGRWAAKEAIAKASSEPLFWQEVEILNAKNGRPVVSIRGKETGILVSITHERTHAAAVAVASD